MCYQTRIDVWEKEDRFWKTVSGLGLAGIMSFVRTVEVNHGDDEEGYRSAVCDEKTAKHGVCDTFVVVPQGFHSQCDHHYPRLRISPCFPEGGVKGYIR